MRAQTQKKWFFLDGGWGGGGGGIPPIKKPLMGGTKIFSETIYAKPYQDHIKWFVTALNLFLYLKIFKILLQSRILSIIVLLHLHTLPLERFFNVSTPLPTDTDALMPRNASRRGRLHDKP